MADSSATGDFAAQARTLAARENRAAILCALVLVLEGYDLGAMAFTLPAISEAWHLKPVFFTASLTAGSVGLFLGSLTCGWLGDRLGRKPVLTGCVAVFGLMSLLTALATGPFGLTLMRFLTGLGVGGGIPTSIALLSDLSPPKRQGRLVMATTCGVPAGNVLGGILASRLIQPFGWQAVFVAGGLLPLILVPLLLFLLPESMAPSKGRAPNAIPQLFKPGLARLTLLVWLINFLSLLTIYFIASWLPSLLHSLGIATAGAIMASAMFQLGGIAGGLGSGPFVVRYGTEKTVALLLGVGGCFLILLGLAHGPALLFAFLVFGAGLGVSAAQLGINALSGAIYPTAIRNTGAGWALGVGRLGNITGPLFGGLLLALGWKPGAMLLLIALPAFALSLALLALAKVRAALTET